jgi:two-component system, NtrC family, sensor kinase
MKFSDVAVARVPAHNHPSVAGWRITRSLRARLLVLVALVVAVVIGIEAYIQTNLFARNLERDLLEMGRHTAQSVADDIEVRMNPSDTAALSAQLHDLIEASPAIRSISVVTAPGGAPDVLASTSSEMRPAALEAGRLAMEQGMLRWDGAPGPIRTVALPVSRDGQPFGAVVVSLSLFSAQRLAASGFRATLWFALAATALLTLLVDRLARRLVYLPIAAIRSTMQRAAEGDLAARAPVERQDELGAVAAGLNDMLREMEGFQVALRQRVAEATDALRQRNAELAENYKRIFTLRAQLARAEQLVAVGQMAASVAHQIGTPLNLISGYVQMMMADTAPGGSARARLQTIEEQIVKVTAVVRTMLHAARRPVSSREPADLRLIGERVCDLARPALDAAGVRLALRVETGATAIAADAVQLEMALLNLVTNSLDAMPDGGLLTLTLADAPEGVRLTVADTGTGIAPDLLPHVFESWVTSKAPGRGTGLGLSITREVIVGHGGTIEARNGPDGGAVFTVTLPRFSGAALGRAEREVVQR